MIDVRVVDWLRIYEALIRSRHVVRALSKGFVERVIVRKDQLVSSNYKIHGFFSDLSQLIFLLDQGEYFLFALAVVSDEIFLSLVSHFTFGAHVKFNLILLADSEVVYG